jgi:hypothetical protein
MHKTKSNLSGLEVPTQLENLESQMDDALTIQVEDT